MKFFFTLLFILGLAICSFGQSSGFIISARDTLEAVVTIKKSKVEDMVYFRHAHQDDWNQVTASNAIEAFIPNKWKYLSVELPLFRE